MFRFVVLLVKREVKGNKGGTSIIAVLEGFFLLFLLFFFVCLLNYFQLYSTMVRYLCTL